MSNCRNSFQVASSFRDPSGFVFHNGNSIYRQINSVYKDNYEFLMSCGLYERLISEILLLQHEEVPVEPPKPTSAYKVIKPEVIPFISYPYEWSFSQLKDAALTSLRIQKKALEYGMSLKDCSAYNIQFKNGKPILIDTLSFERYTPGQPWVGYRQFCQHFLGPLALMSYTDLRLNQLLRIYIDGIPLDLTSRLLPSRTYLSIPIMSHIHFHSRNQEHFRKRASVIKKCNIPKYFLEGLVDNLISMVQNLKSRGQDSHWADYYADATNQISGTTEKRVLISEILDAIKPASVWDIGANTGEFSFIAAQKGIQTISLDNDPVVVEQNYLKCLRTQTPNVLPLIIDFTNPSADIGWENEERTSLVKRGPADLVLVLALIHHLVFTQNIPLHKIAGLLSRIARKLVVEFIPKTDFRVQQMLSQINDRFRDYSAEIFEKEFGFRFKLQKVYKIGQSQRMLYQMENRASI